MTSWKEQACAVELMRAEDLDEYVDQMMVTGFNELSLRAELRELSGAHEEMLLYAFVKGAKWWEYKKTGATMWQSDQADAFEAAREHLRNGWIARTMEHDDECCACLCGESEG